MPTLRIDPPSEKQILFLTADTMHVGFGGARGGGKSGAGAQNQDENGIFFENTLG